MNIRGADRHILRVADTGVGSGIFDLLELEDE